MCKMTNILNSELHGSVEHAMWLINVQNYSLRESVAN